MALRADAVAEVAQDADEVVVRLPLDHRQLHVVLDAALPRRRLEAEDALVLAAGHGGKLQEVTWKGEEAPKAKVLSRKDNFCTNLKALETDCF